MAGDGFITQGNKVYEGKITVFVVLTCIVAASGGLIFGYDIGVAGGVTSMDNFLAKFFPHMLVHRADRNTYCRYNNQGLQLFTSSLYLAGLIATFFASWTTRNLGRRPTMFMAGICFMIGAVFNAAAQNLAMLIVGRILLGIGLGFSNQTVPLYLSEMAPSNLRGALNQLFQLFCAFGILVANLINLGTEQLDWGWRLSLGLVIVPAAVLTLGGVFLPETPNSLLERNHTEAGRAVLERIRGTQNVQEEYNDILAATQRPQAVRSPMRELFRRSNLPPLSVAIFVPMFQQFTGINAIDFYAPVLFKTFGFGSNSSLYSAVITGTVIFLGTFVSIFTVDRWGRKFLFYEGGIQMIICQVCVGLILKSKLPLSEDLKLPHPWPPIVVALICIYVAGFSWSWGPLGWLLPSEVFPLEVRSAAQSITVSVNFLFTFVIGQAFLTMLCSFRWMIFIFFALLTVVMTLYIAFFVPETKNIPIEDMNSVWAQHWLWKHFVDDQQDGIQFGINKISPL